METHSEMHAALDRHLDALLHGEPVVDLDESLPGSARSPQLEELHELVAIARLTMDALEESLPPATQARHLRLLQDAAARWGPRRPNEP
jgi:hypothetical protein